jgi:quinol monooxygenase YgiN
MIRHIALMKFKPDVSTEEIGQLLDALRGLPEQISEIQSWQVAAASRDLSQTYQAVLTAEFADKAALDRYLAHPAHVPVLALAERLCEHIPVIDYEF